MSKHTVKATDHLIKYKSHFPGWIVMKTKKGHLIK